MEEISGSLYKVGVFEPNFCKYAKKKQFIFFQNSASSMNMSS